jgi:serine/threonine-protein kinase
MPGWKEQASPPDEASGAKTVVEDEQDPGSRAGTLAPYYVDRGEIGRGGMGTVRRVRDARLLRDVAMKTLASDDGSRAHVEQFVQEAQIAGQLEHPNVVPVHELGTNVDGTVYFTMKLVRGQSLYEWIWHRRSPPEAAERIEDGLEIFVKVCDAVSFAHSRGVIHRDLKPANVMVGEFGEVYLTDWGLAKLTGAGVRISGTAPSARRSVVGTPGYMAPEQARGDAHEHDERTDVYGLGALLYEIVVGKPPYPPSAKFPDPDAIRGEYVPPEEALGETRVSGRLLRIVKRALAPERADRYPSVAQLQADVKRFQRGGMLLPRTSFAPGTPILVEGDVGDEAYIILRGECVAYKTIDGEKRVLRRMGRGDVFGELAILSDVPRTATVEAVDQVTALVVTRATLAEELGPDSWVAALVRALADRFRDLDAQR